MLSGVALRGWIANLIPNRMVQLVSMPATSHDQGLSITNLSGQEFATLLFTLTALMPWGAANMAAGRSAGSFHFIQVLLFLFFVSGDKKRYSSEILDMESLHQLP